MKKILKFAFLCVLLAALFWTGSVLADRKSLDEDLIRFHVVANSDSQEDQRIKLQLRDVLTKALQRPMSQCRDAQAAEYYLQENLKAIETLANSALAQMGCSDSATVTLRDEAFDTRVYDTFSLPAGVYRSLRITIGEGKGENWWCVVFPSLCLPATSEDFDAVAADSGFQKSLAGALDHQQGYEVRFFLLDCLGRLRNFFYGG